MSDNNNDNNGGVVRDVRNIDIKIKRNKDQAVPHEIKLMIDYTDVDREELIIRAMKTDVIRMQSKMRKWSISKLEDCELEGHEIDGITIGDRSERNKIDLEAIRKDLIEKMVATGMTQEVAEGIVADMGKK